MSEDEKSKPSKNTNYTLRATDRGDYFVIEVECPRCRQIVKATGLPVLVPYTNDHKRRKVASGLMFVRPSDSHNAVCLPPSEK
jgi:exosome complex RNA-binding protein Csl4